MLDSEYNFLFSLLLFLIPIIYLFQPHQEFQSIFTPHISNDQFYIALTFFLIWIGVH